MKKLFVIVAIAILIVVGVGLWNQKNEPVDGEGVEFQIAFNDAQSLEAGDPVTMEGQSVGEVRGIRPNPDGEGTLVTVHVAQKYAPYVHQPPDSSARIIEAGWLWNTTRVDIVNRGDTSLPVDDNAMVMGMDDWQAEELFYGREVIEEGIAGITAAAQERLDQARQALESEKAQQVRQDIESLRKDLEDYTVQTAEVSQEKLDQLMEKSRNLTERLQKMGEGDTAARLESIFLDLKERVSSGPSEEVKEDGGIILEAGPDDQPEPSPTPVLEMEQG